MRIPITKPFLGDEEKKRILEVIDSGWVVQGPNTHEFEDKFAKYTNSKHSFATTSCTTALHMALVAEGIGEGHDVIVPSFTFVASANAIEYVKATPVFCDIELDTFNISVNSLTEIIRNDYDYIDGKLINKKTHKILKALIPVHLFGLAADMIEINKIARGYNLIVIEDAACALGATINGTHVGSFGNTACYSLHPRKAITTGEGGVLTTDCDERAQTVIALRNHGATVSDLQRHKKAGYLLPEYNMVGFNYRLTDLQGALATIQMDKLDYILKMRAEWAKKYDEKLADIKWLVTPKIPSGYTHGYQSYVCLIDMVELGFDNVEKANEWRNKLMDSMEQKGIATRQGTHAVHTLGFYKKKYKIDNSKYINSYKADRLSICLPLFVTMTEEEQNAVVQELKNANLK